MRAVLVSHNFNPGHFSHIIANYKLLAEARYDVGFRWSTKFDGLEPKIAAGTSKVPLHSIDRDSLFIVWFPSLKALLDMIVLRSSKRAKIVYVYHEPFESLRAYLAAGFGLKKTARIVAVSAVNRLLVTCSHKIVLPSKRAFDTFTKSANGNKPCLYLPLMFDDEADPKTERMRRKYVSYIGTIAADHAFDEFLKFVRHSLQNELFPDHSFLIATRSPLPAEWLAGLETYVERGRLVVSCGRPMSNDEINAWYAQSVVVWNAYRRSMQSGVLPKAYMFGTPVITSAANRSEFFTDGENGVEISTAYAAEELRSAIARIISRSEYYSTACRRKFLDCFYYKSSSAAFLRFVEGD
jgi:glycosyltransferase involved in cell wall biosynthesis